jgi:hypothetical protein
VTARRILAALPLAVLASAALAAGAQAIDLTGTWVGKWTCQGFDGAKFKSSNKQSTLLITQNGNALAASIDGDFTYNGGVIPDLRNPDGKGEAALVGCANDVIPFAGGESEIVRAKVKTSASGAGSFKGLAVLESDFPDVLTCKYSYRRTSTENPNVPAC